MLLAIFIASALAIWIGAWIASNTPDERMVALFGAISILGGIGVAICIVVALVRGML